jgi:hypothetical protein
VTLFTLHGRISQKFITKGTQQVEYNQRKKITPKSSRGNLIVYTNNGRTGKTSKAWQASQKLVTAPGSSTSSLAKQ